MKALELVVIFTLFLAVLFIPLSRHIDLQPPQTKQIAKEPEVQAKPAPEKEKKPLPVSEKKKRFLNTVLPAVQKVYAKLDKRYEMAKQAIENNSSKEFINNLKQEYDVQSDEALLRALKPHPKSIALAQAAVESAWATSRFFKLANNLFGVWSFSENEPRVAAKGSREGQTVWLRKYDSVADSVEHYYKTIATGFAYKEFRKKKMQTDNPYTLVKKLHRYSEKGDAYGKLLSAIIKHNKFHRYDEMPDNS